jgi:sec-independent protein translocase protein TatA
MLPGPGTTGRRARRWNVFSGPWEIILVILVILLLFGPKKLPDLARSIGRSLSEFRKGRDEGAKELESGKNENGKKPADGTTADDGGAGTRK